VNTVSCLASECPELYRLATLIAALTNPGCHWDLRGMPEAERLAAVAELVEEWEEVAG
jgi:hypothetical protein